MILAMNEVETIFQEPSPAITKREKSRVEAVLDPISKAINDKLDGSKFVKVQALTLSVNIYFATHQSTNQPTHQPILL